MKHKSATKYFEVAVGMLSVLVQPAGLCGSRPAVRIYRYARRDQNFMMHLYILTAGSDPQRQNLPWFLRRIESNSIPQPWGLEHCLSLLSVGSSLFWNVKKIESQKFSSQLCRLA